MRFYLSSYKVGNEAETLKLLVNKRRIGYIPNAIDYLEPDARAESDQRNMKDLTDLGIELEMLDLKEYFGKKERLEERLRQLGGVWVRGGNTFVLRQAMRLSGFDEIIKGMRDDFLYAGYSAGICVLSPVLPAIVDDPTIMPYEGSEVIMKGLGILDYVILPHYQSDHPESADIDKEVQWCQENNIPFKPLRDGEVIIL